MNHDYRELNAQEEYYNDLNTFVRNSDKSPSDILEARIHLTALTNNVTADEVREYVRNNGYQILSDKTFEFSK